MPGSRENRNDGPSALFKKQCPVCEEHFRTDNERTVYCSLKCKQHADFQRYYERHGDNVRLRMRLYQREKRQD